MPGSMLIYGSNFCIVTLKPRDSNSLAIDDEMIPFPSDETTPPVTKMYLVSTINISLFITNCKDSYFPSIILEERLNFFSFFGDSGKNAIKTAPKMVKKMTEKEPTPFSHFRLFAVEF